MKSNHPFEAFIPKNADKLIIGTIPPFRFCTNTEELKRNDVRFYYGSSDNNFWKIIARIFKVDLIFENSQIAIDQRKQFLQSINTGITDLIGSCEHEDGYASDNKLRDIKHKDIGKLLNENPDIDKLVYTSEYVKREMNQIFKSYHKISKNDKKLQYLKLSNKQYEVRILYSPSPQALINMGRGGAEKRDNQYRKFLK